MTLEELKNRYRLEQDSIAKKRKNKQFASKEDDICEQELSWINYLRDKWKITGNEEDKKELLDYLKGKLRSNYVDLRNRYLTGNLLESEYKKNRIDLSIDYEKVLFELGLIKLVTTQKEKDVYLNEAFNYESTEKLKGKHKISDVNVAFLCIKQTPIIDQYFRSLEDKNTFNELSKKTNNI